LLRLVNLAQELSAGAGRRSTTAHVSPRFSIALSVEEPAESWLSYWMKAGAKAKRGQPDTIQPSKRWEIAKMAAIILCAVLPYLPALRGGFVWDDEPLITANPLLRAPSGLAEIWSGSRTADYFPVTNTVFWIEHHLFGANATGYHAFNILLQAANALLLWRVLRRLQIPGAFLSGLIFAVHPIHAESVAWISELKNMLSMFFFLISALCFFEIEDQRILNRSVAYSASLVAFLLALLSKTQVVFMPVALLLCAWWRNSPVDSKRQRKGKPSRFQREVVRTVPFFLIAIVFGLITIWFQNRGIGEEEIVLGSFTRRLTNAGMAIWWYAKQVFAPVRLMAVYPQWRFDPPSLAEWLPLIALAGALLLFWRRHSRGLLFAFAYFIVALLPVTGIVRMSYARSGALVADHLQYFADISLIALFSAGVACLWSIGRRGTRIATGTIIVVLLGLMGSYTWARAGVYRDEQTLWQDNFSKNPDAWQGHNRIGQLLFNQEKFAEAVPHFERAVQLKPELAENYNLLGLVYCRVQRFEEGIAQYRKGLQLKEEKRATAQSISTATMRVNLANALALTGNTFSDLARAASDQGDMAAAQADTKEANARFAEAIEQYEKALAIEPEHPAIHRNLGILLSRLGRTEEAIPHLRKVLQLVPNEPSARETLEAIEAQRQ
jgi:Flp pilus assembly protein TadD